MEKNLAIRRNKTKQSNRTEESKATKLKNPYNQIKQFMSTNLNNKSTVNRPAQVQVPMAVVTQRVSCSSSWNWTRLSMIRNRVHRGNKGGGEGALQYVLMLSCFEINFVAMQKLFLIAFLPGTEHGSRWLGVQGGTTPEGTFNMFLSDFVFWIQICCNAKIIF